MAVCLAGCAKDAVPPAPRPALEEPPVASSPAGSPDLCPAQAPMIAARSALLLDARTGRVLYQKNADARTQVASTQKLLSALLVVRSGDLDRQVVIQEQDTRVEPTKLGLRAGERYSRRSLLTAMMVKSENDAAAALARDVAGSVTTFVAGMNHMAWDLGARNSFFANPHGLPAPQYSTARDIGRIAFCAYREPTLRQMMATRTMTFVFNSGRRKFLENTNKLLKRNPFVNGMKTGYTDAAGRCLVASASSGGKDLIFVQLGSRTTFIFDDAERMLAWGMQQ